MYMYTMAFLDICLGQADHISILVYRLCLADVRKGQLETGTDIFRYGDRSLVFTGVRHIISRRQIDQRSCYVIFTAENNGVVCKISMLVHMTAYYHKGFIFQELLLQLFILGSPV